ncbi:hypothetical protein [Legionella fallonii]|uniref:Uncharacterized protein n=1 Tax=Legionella fallonii LLAP-10 TaxID=1212491 RepID=A0A098G0S3_9GAMM|nr:hypothetical protein [Legionella fallonii]CEG56063.1 conserved protein of unknown function [Legionella fallonii LLAP-10]
MLDQDAYEQISRVFDEWERARLQQPNQEPQLTLDYDEVLRDLEKLQANEKDSDVVRVALSAERYNDKPVAGIQNPSKRKSSNVVSQCTGSQGGNLYFWDSNFNRTRMVSAGDIYPKMRQSIHTWKRMDSGPNQTSSASSSSRIAETDVDSKQNKRSTATRSSSGIFDKKSAKSRTNPSDNEKGKESNSNCSPSM